MGVGASDKKPVSSGDWNRRLSWDETTEVFEHHSKEFTLYPVGRTEPSKPFNMKFSMVLLRNRKLKKAPPSLAVKTSRSLY